jgi:hypothetical protein
MIEAVPETKTLSVIDAFTMLLDSRNKQRPPGAFSYAGPAGKLLTFMEKAMGSRHGLPSDGAALIAFLKVPAHIKAIRESQILVSFIPDPRAPLQRDQDSDVRNWPPMIRLERAVHETEYRDRPGSYIG